jgi:ribosomal protein L14
LRQGGSVVRYDDLAAVIVESYPGPGSDVDACTPGTGGTRRDDH